MYEETISKQVVLEKSRVYIFNRIGDYAIKNGLKCTYFENQITNFITMEQDRCGTKTNIVHYIHIYKEEELIMSIFLDNDSIYSPIPCSYYEMYYNYEVQKFYDSEEEILFMASKSIIDKEVV